MIKSPVNPKLNVTLVASAGTGKTYNLSLRVLALLTKGFNPNGILCVTFTNKAAEEMSTRINNLASKMAVGDFSGLDSELSALKELTGFDEDFIRKRLASAREKMFTGGGNIRIKTVQSFINMILNLFPFESGLRPGYEIITDESENELKEDAYTLVFAEIFSDPKWKSFFKIFEESAESVSGRGVDIIKEYTESLLESGLTFRLADKYADTPENLLEEASELKDIRGSIIKNMHRFAKLMQEETLNKNQQKQIDGFLKADMKKILSTKYLLSGDPYSGYYKKFTYKDGMLNLYDEIYNRIKKYVELKGVIETSVSCSAGKLFFERVDGLKQKKNVISFGDIVDKGAKLLTGEHGIEDKEYLYFRLDGRISHILIDEFQDTSVPEWKIIEPLVDEAMSGVGQKDVSGSYFCVGDPKQTLYRFRGGERRLFDYVLSRYHGKIEKMNLAKSFRSFAEVLEPVNILFSKTPLIEYVPVEAAKGTGGFSGIYFCDDDRFDFAYKKAYELIEKGFRLNDIAILVDTNQKAEKYADYLNLKDVPARAETSEKLADSQIFMAVYSAFEYLYSQNPFSCNVFCFAEPPCIETERGAGLDEYMSKLNSVRVRTAGLCVGGIFKILDAEMSLHKRFFNDSNYSAVSDIIYMKLANIKSIPEFLEKFEREGKSVSAKWQAGKEAVTIMTVYKSKGLEFEAVILPDLTKKMQVDAAQTKFIFERDEGGVEYGGIYRNVSKDVVPVSPEKFQQALEEENIEYTIDALNMLYVAMTRAKRVCVSAVGEKPGNGTLEEFVSSSLELPFVCGDYAELSPPENEAVQKKEEPEKIFKFKPLKKIDFDMKASYVDFLGTEYGKCFHEAVYLLLGGISYENVSTRLKAEYEIFIGEKSVELAFLSAKSVFNDDFMRTFENGLSFREQQLSDDSGMCVADYFSVFEDKIVLVDFKTGEQNGGLIKKYEKQVKRYSDILEKMYERPVEKYLCFADPDNVVWINI